MPDSAARLLHDTVTDRMGRGDAALAVHDLAEIPTILARIEARTHERLWNVQRYYALSLNRRTWDLDRRSRSRQIEERTVVSRRGSAHFPLLTTVEPGLRIGPVSYPLLIADSAFALFNLPASSSGESLSVSTTDAGLVALATAAFLEVWDQSVSWEEAGLRTPLPERRFRVAVLLTDGYTDREIAEELGIGTRTVSVEVRAVVDWLGARGRTHAIAMLVGAA